MSKSIAVITIHGMGDTDVNYYKSLKKKLRKYVGGDMWDELVHFESVYFQDLLQGNQEEYWEEIDDEYSLRWDFLRKFRDVSRERESSEQFVWLNRRYGETETQLSRWAITPSMRADSSQDEVI